MKTTICAAGIAAAAGLLITSPAAGAAPGVDGFVYDVQAAGFNIDADNEMAYVALGLGVCVELFSGNTYGGVSSEMKGITSMTASDAMEFVSIAVNDLCPDAIYAGVA